MGLGPKDQAKTRHLMYNSHELMRIATLALLLSALASPVHAVDEGVPVKFNGQPLKQQWEAPSGVRTSSVVWESGPSNPVPTGFKALLLEGVVSRPGISFEASVRQDGDWGPWTAATGERFANGNFWAKMTVSGEKEALVRLRAIDADPAAGLAVQIDFFGLHASQMQPEASDNPQRASFQKTAATLSAASMPGVHPRSDWGALASKPYEIMTPVRITVHHTDGRQAMTKKAAIDELHFIQSFHQHGRGWIDIAYHFLIDGSGGIWEGRPVLVVGSHVKEKNEGNIGISLMGDFHPPKNQKPTDNQIKSLVELLRWLTAAYHIPTDKKYILGHRDQEQTDCPGDNLYILLDGIRDSVSKPQAPADALIRKTDTAASRIHFLAPRLILP